MPKKYAAPSALLNHTLIGQRLAALLVLGWLLFNYPLLALFNDAASWCGIPLLVAYLFGAWALFIALLAWIVERAPQEPAPASTSAPLQSH